MGRYYYYYKWAVSGHNNISAIKAHQQFDEVLRYLSIPETILKKIQMESFQMLDAQYELSHKQMDRNKGQFNEIDEKLKSIEKKWINNQIEVDTYNRWYRELSDKKMALRAQLDKTGESLFDTKQLLNRELLKLSDLKYIYYRADTLQKQMLIRPVFDCTLFYQ